MKFTAYRQIIIAIVASMAIAGPASAQVLYQDPLTGSGSPTTLAGTTPPTTQGTNAWTGKNNSGANVFANGTWTSGTSSVGLAYTFTDGNIYNLSVDVTTNASESGAMLEYNDSGQLFGRNNVVGMRFDQGTGGNLNVSYIANSGGTLSSTTALPDGQLADIVLNTTGGDGNWFATYSYDGTTLGTVTITLAEQAALTSSGVGLASGNGGTGQFSDFTFQEGSSVPEPSTYALIVVCLGFLVLVARRQRV
ncbi:MAG: PEP-CTERM sorting domain-containing protein [Methylacidiphilales bacterium]|nr:PEP-CTERM sorting domain-containing protein [Candidatus Methylacidiphilales bacterium]